MGRGRGGAKSSSSPFQGCCTPEQNAQSLGKVPRYVGDENGLSGVNWGKEKIYHVVLLHVLGELFSSFVRAPQAGASSLIFVRLQMRIGIRHLYFLLRLRQNPLCCQDQY